MAIIKKLTGHEGMNCEVKDYGDMIVFTSYRTIVAVAEQNPDTNKWVIKPEGKYWDGSRLYTHTTARQLGFFLREYFTDVKYQDFKTAAINNEIIEDATRRR